MKNIADERSAKRAQPLILVTDDDDDTRFLFRTMLGMQGYSVIEAADGEQAVHLAESARPDLILMDASLPQLDGLGATRRIRQLGHVGRIPIVFVSGYAEPSYRAVAFDAGCDEYLVKPLDFAQLLVVLDKRLGRKMSAPAT